VEYSDKLEQFVSNTLAPAKTKKVEIVEKPGKKIVVITVIPREKGRAIGKNGKNIHRSRFLLKRHFGVTNVIIQSTN
jgi:N utilization substance protein A